MKNVFFFLMMVLLVACREEYHTNVPTPDTGYLVVEGFINLMPDSTTNITLSRTTKLDTSFVKYEPGASVVIEGEDNSFNQLYESASGRYTSAPLRLSPNIRYRIHIITNDQKQYISDYSESKICPVIDSITWSPAVDNQIQVAATAHDDQNKTIYYLWNYEETWEYRTMFQSTIIYVPASNSFIDRDLQHDDIYKCWQHDHSTNIIIGSTAKLSKDVMYKKPIVLIPMDGSDKLISLYSIFVRQYALTKDAYNYLDLMRKNTEQLGSIFDAQPSQLKGNIHNIEDSSEVVVGYMYTTSFTQKRIFIDRADLPYHYILSGYEECMVDTVENDKAKIAAVFSGGGVLGVQPIYEMGFLSGYSYTTPYCADCRIKGGTTTKPDFWP